jgi:hypothetical protein
MRLRALVPCASRALLYHYARMVNALMLKCTTTTQLYWRCRSQEREMYCRGMLIHCCGRLGAAVALGVAEIQCGDAMLAGSALECGATVHRFGYVITHNFHCSPL